ATNQHQRPGGQCPGLRGPGCGPSQGPGVTARLLSQAEGARCRQCAGRSLGGIAGGLELAGGQASVRRRNVPAGGEADPPPQAGNRSAPQVGSAFQDCGLEPFRSGAL
ncbi:hypothetical protein, partial [Arthrobacter sp. DR-2P]